MVFRSFAIRLIYSCLFSAICLGFSGCGSKQKRSSQDGPPSVIPANLDRIPNAVPKVEPLSRYGNRFKKNSTNTYVALNRKYSVMPTGRGYRARGMASWYGTKFQGRRTSSGEPYNMFSMTAAHRTLPLPSYIKVTNLENGKHVIVKVNDRGPFHNNRLLDLSYVAAHKLGILGRGTGHVEVQSIDPRDHQGKVPTHPVINSHPNKVVPFIPSHHNRHTVIAKADQESLFPDEFEMSDTRKTRNSSHSNSSKGNISSTSNQKGNRLPAAPLTTVTSLTSTPPTTSITHLGTSSGSSTTKTRNPKPSLISPSTPKAPLTQPNSPNKNNNHSVNIAAIKNTLQNNPNIPNSSQTSAGKSVITAKTLSAAPARNNLSTIQMPSKNTVKNPTNKLSNNIAIKTASPAIKTPNSKISTSIKNKVINQSNTYVQLGTYNTKINALALAKKVEKISKVPPQISEIFQKKGSVFKVRLGPFKNEEALQLSQKLTKAKLPTPIITHE